MSFLGNVWAWLTTSDHWSGRSGIPQRLWEHLRLSFVSVLLAAVIALPIGIWLGHRRQFGALAINISNIGRAVPSFALLVLGAQVWGIDEWHGMSKAALLALFALALPPMVTNSYVALAQVPDDVRDAARGMGMTGAQSLWRAELPVAVPLVMNGVRIAMLQVVATAGLAAVVASGGLGRFIVDGFAVRDYPQVFAGAVLVAGLALVIEGGLSLVQRQATPRGVRLTASRRPD